jgi:hypothetical protein
VIKGKRLCELDLFMLVDFIIGMMKYGYDWRVGFMDY